MTRILLIEDNEDHAELIRRSLQKGFGKIQLKLSPGAQDAYRLLQRKSFDLILSDYYLPGIDGDEHIRELHKRAPKIPIVIITGQGDEKIAARSIQSGAEDYVVKTREALEALPAILKRAIVKHRSHQTKKSLEIRRHLSHQKRHAEKVLGEMEEINKHMKRLKRGKRGKSPPPEGGEDLSALEQLTQQFESLKKFFKSMFVKK
ncbi:MAG: response regulator [Deltaproteobacteria bacterium]|nr:response regulator [Deltaproteobacteria bacterium]